MSASSSHPFTRVPNVIFDLLTTLGNAEARVVLAVVRHTFGFQRDRAVLSFSDLQESTGLSRPAISRATEALPAMTTVTEGQPFFYREPQGQSYAYWVDVEALVTQRNQLRSVTTSGNVALPPLVTLRYQSLYKEGKKGLKKKERGAKPSKSEAVPTFGADTWQRQYAERAWTHLDGFARLSGSVKRKRETTLAAWADVLDKLHRLDGHTPEEIAAVFRWLFTEDNWWIREGNFRSLAKLRQTVRGEEGTYFELFALRMATEKNGHRLPDLTRPLHEHERDTAIRLRKDTLTAADFYEAGRDPHSGAVLYKLMAQKREALTHA